MVEPTEYQFYNELANWWPLILPPSHYSYEAELLASILNDVAPDAREVLDVGSGGGHLAFHLKDRYAMTLTDLSEGMLAVSRELNPECEHVQGDMRTMRLGRTFDAVLVYEAVAYMISEPDLRQTLETAFAHTKPGGTAVVIPDTTRETFEPWNDHGGTDHPDGRGARYLDWTWDPSPEDSWIQTEFVFILREADGTVRVVPESHRTGLFGCDEWLGLLKDVGFEGTKVIEHQVSDKSTMTVFVTRHPA